MTNLDQTIDDSTWQVPAFTIVDFDKRKHDYALVIPVINEGSRIRAQLERIRDQQLPIDVIIADGGSTDGSLADDFIRQVNVRALLTKTGDGKLSAQLRMAYAWCLREGYKGIVTIDGNGKDGVEAIETFVARLDAGYDYVQGSRYAPGGQAENTPLERTIGNRMIHAPMLSLAGKFWLTDTTNGFRGYSSRYLLDPKLSPFRSIFMRYELLFYLTIRAGQLGYRICEVPVRRSYPLGQAAPTKITGTKAHWNLFKQTFFAAIGRYSP
jgi:dolichol-phosphate mannosyltransferase